MSGSAIIGAHVPRNAWHAFERRDEFEGERDGGRDLSVYHAGR